MTRKEACYYLGIGENSSSEQIKRAYRYKAKLYHPDENPDMDTKEYYIKIQSAYEFLMENPPFPAQTVADPDAAQPGSGPMPGAPVFSWQSMYGYPNGQQFRSPQGARPAKVYSSTASARASYQKQKEKEKERRKLQKWDEEYRSSRKRQQQKDLYGVQYADDAADEEERILEKIRAIWLAETIKRQIAQDKEHKEALQRRKLYRAFMQQTVQQEGAEGSIRPAKGAEKGRSKGGYGNDQDQGSDI